MKTLTLATLSILCLVFAACGSKSDTSSGAVEAGKKYFAQSGCTLCHGDDAAGKPTVAPALRGLKAFYTKEKLVAYLENPMEYEKADKRLMEQAPKFTGAMPGYAMLGKEKLEALADYVLTL